MEAEAIILADRRGVIRYWSSGATAMFGYRVDQAVGQLLDLIVPDEHRDAHWKGFRRAFESGTAAAEGIAGPFPAKHADGSIVTRTGRLSLVRQPQGKVVAALVVFE
ncbi:MAG TPA: PAS domain S-box protein [Rudaea sp.]|nr:PAS domain S-box protein [Rudaea sp.]